MHTAITAQKGDINAFHFDCKDENNKTKFTTKTNKRIDIMTEPFHKVDAIYTSSFFKK